MNKILIGFGLITFTNIQAVYADGQPPIAVPDSSATAASTPPVAVAQTGAAPVANAPQQPGFMGMAMPFVLMFAVVYFFMIRPQQKKVKEHQGLLSSLKQGDEVITAAGILGKVTGIAEKFVTVEIADQVKVKVLKTQIGQVLKGGSKDLA